MKNLKNNFTTPEQSKRLLELGVPADSADCYWHSVQRSAHSVIRRELRWLEPPYLDHYTEYVKMASGHDIYRENRMKTYLPCWSVGRLIEIYCICDDSDITITPLNGNIIDFMISAFEISIDLNDIDFSKLED